MGNLETEFQSKFSFEIPHEIVSVKATPQNFFDIKKNRY